MYTIQNRIGFIGVHKINVFIVSLYLCLSSACSYLPNDEINPSNEVVITETRDYIFMRPFDQKETNTGILFYPGGLVDPHVYNQWLSELVLSDPTYTVIVLKMPANLAVLNSNAATMAINDFPYITNWVIAGHSLGGAMACSYVAAFPNSIKGLVLLAAYPAQSVDLTSWQGAVLSIAASEDGLASAEDIEDSKLRLPTSVLINTPNMMPTNLQGKTVFYTINGGNHAYFGHYGPQNNDGEALITREEQQYQVLELMRQFFTNNDWD
jgi:dienelactone hydrolase